MKKKRREFTREDAFRGIEICLEDVEIIGSQIHANDLTEGWNFSALARSHELLALSYIAIGEHGRSLGHLGAAAGSWAELLEARLRGAQISQEAVDRFGATPFLFGSAAGDETLVKHLATLCDKTFGEADLKKPIPYAGMVVKALAIGETNRARDLLASPPAALDPQALEFWRSIAERDHAGFHAGLARFEEWWRDRVESEHLEAMPDAVGDLFSVGAIKFAERTWGERLNVTVGKIPQEYFDATPERVAVGL